MLGITGVRRGAGGIAWFRRAISVRYRRIDDVGVAGISAVVSGIEYDDPARWYGGSRHSGFPCTTGFWARRWCAAPVVGRPGGGGRRVGGAGGCRRVRARRGRTGRVGTGRARTCWVGG